MTVAIATSPFLSLNSTGYLGSWIRASFDKLQTCHPHFPLPRCDLHMNITIKSDYKGGMTQCMGDMSNSLVNIKFKIKTNKMVWYSIIPYDL